MPRMLGGASALGPAALGQGAARDHRMADVAVGHGDALELVAEGGPLGRHPARDELAVVGVGAEGDDAQRRRVWAVAARGAPQTRAAAARANPRRSLSACRKGRAIIDSSFEATGLAGAIATSRELVPVDPGVEDFLRLHELLPGHFLPLGAAVRPSIAASADSAPGAASFRRLPLVMLSMNAFCLFGVGVVEGALEGPGDGERLVGGLRGLEARDTPSWSSPEMRTGAS